MQTWTYALRRHAGLHHLVPLPRWSAETQQAGSRFAFDMHVRLRVSQAVQQHASPERTVGGNMDNWISSQWSPTASTARNQGPRTDTCDTDPGRRQFSCIWVELGRQGPLDRRDERGAMRQRAGLQLHLPNCTSRGLTTACAQHGREPAHRDRQHQVPSEGVSVTLYAPNPSKRAQSSRTPTEALTWADKVLTGQ
jgi:hypothetical protein